MSKAPPLRYFLPMSLELILVFALQAPPSASDLQSAIDREHIPVRVSSSANLLKDVGFLSADYASLKSGFYLAHSTYAELLSDYPEAALPDSSVQAVLSFGYGGNFLECASVFSTASVLVSNFGAKAFDTESVTYLSAHELTSNAESCFEEWKKSQGASRALSPEQKK